MTQRRRHIAGDAARSRDPGLKAIRAVGIVVIMLVLAGMAWLLLGDGLASPAPKQWDSPPPMTIDPDRRYVAIVHMENGDEFTIEMYAAKAPVTVNNFVF